ncbi:MAG: hypothetical protein ABIW49_06215 [Knoellia sp.]
METLALRVVLPSLTVLLAGWVQQRLGPRHSGRLIGLPLTSGPFLAVLLLIEGPQLTVTAARGVAMGQLMVVAFAATYAVLTVARWRPTSALLGGTSAVAVLGAAVHAWLPWHAALVVPIVAALVLIVWRPEPQQQSAAQARTSPAGGAAAVRGLLARGALTGGLVGALSLAAPLLGASLAGLLASIPLVVAVLAPSAHARTGAVTARTLLRGTLAVVPGTTAFALVVATVLPVCEPVVAFGLALAALATLNWLIGAADGAAQRLRMP